MEFKCSRKLGECKCQCAIIPFFKAQEGQKLNLPKWANSLEGEFDASEGKISLLRSVRVEGALFEKALLLGLGEENKQNPHTIAGFYACAFCALKAGGAASIAVQVEKAELAKRIAMQIFMADYSFSKYRSEQGGQKQVGRIFFVCRDLDS
ncbi:MAG: M17 family peptidase N-terminal domain-containing protein, partial [Candidatus Micrarchaeota archaeon]